MTPARLRELAERWFATGLRPFAKSINAEKEEA